MTDKQEFDTDFTDEVVCPWCGYEHGDSWEFSDEQRYDCDECKRPFHLSRDIEVTYSTSRIEAEPSDQGSSDECA